MFCDFGTGNDGSHFRSGIRLRSGHLALALYRDPLPKHLLLVGRDLHQIRIEVHLAACTSADRRDPSATPLLRDERCHGIGFPLRGALARREHPASTTATLVLESVRHLVGDDRRRRRALAKREAIVHRERTRAERRQIGCTRACADVIERASEDALHRVLMRDRATPLLALVVDRRAGKSCNASAFAKVLHDRLVRDATAVVRWGPRRRTLLRPSRGLGAGAISRTVLHVSV